MFNLYLTIRACCYSSLGICVDSASHTLNCSIHSKGQVEPARLAGFRQHGITGTRPRRGLAIGRWADRQGIRGVVNTVYSSSGDCEM